MDSCPISLLYSRQYMSVISNQSTLVAISGTCANLNLVSIYPGYELAFGHNLVQLFSNNFSNMNSISPSNYFCPVFSGGNRAFACIMTFLTSMFACLYRGKIIRLSNQFKLYQRHPSAKSRDNIFAFKSRVS
jgi:hypothetical protein